NAENPPPPWRAAGGERRAGGRLLAARRSLLASVAIEVPSAAGHADSDRVDLLRRLDLVALTAKQRPCRGAERFSGAIETFEDFCDVIRRQKCVGIAQRDELAARDANRLIRCGGEAAILCVDDLLRPRKELTHE